MDNRKGDRALCVAMAICAASACVLSQMGCSGRDQSATEDRADVWLPPTSYFYAGQKAWGLAVPGVPILQLVDAKTVNSYCDHAPNAEAAGCTFLDVGTIVIRNDMSSQETAATTLHELGHFITGNLEHIRSPHCAEYNATSAYVMCPYGAILLEPTAADMDWALGKE